MGSLAAGAHRPAGASDTKAAARKLGAIPDRRSQRRPNELLDELGQVC